MVEEDTEAVGSPVVPFADVGFFGSGGGLPHPAAVLLPPVPLAVINLPVAPVKPALTLLVPLHILTLIVGIIHIQLVPLPLLHVTFEPTLVQFPIEVKYNPDPLFYLILPGFRELPKVHPVLVLLHPEPRLVTLLVPRSMRLKSVDQLGHPCLPFIQRLLDDVPELPLRVLNRLLLPPLPLGLLLGFMVPLLLEQFREVEITLLMFPIVPGHRVQHLRQVDFGVLSFRTRFFIGNIELVPGGFGGSDFVGSCALVDAVPLGLDPGQFRFG